MVENKTGRRVDFEYWECGTPKMLDWCRFHNRKTQMVDTMLNDVLGMRVLAILLSVRIYLILQFGLRRPPFTLPAFPEIAP